MNIQCPRCGKIRNFRPATIARLKTHVCKECIDKEFRDKRTVLTCPHCGSVRRLRSSIGSRHITHSCLKCPRHVPGIPIPDDFDGGYVLGVVMGDGHIACLKQKGGYKTYIIRLSVTSKAFADRFRDALHSVTGHMPWQTIQTSTKRGDEKIGFREKAVTQHVVGLTNRDWFDRLKPMKKQRNFSTLKDKSEAFKRGFVQGMIDSEGYQNPKYIDVANKDRELLQILVEYLCSFGEAAKIYGPYTRGVFHLRMKPSSWLKTTG